MNREDFLEANQRASALLNEHLTPEQREQNKRWGYFIVRGSEGGIWQLHTGYYQFAPTRKMRPCHRKSGGPTKSGLRFSFHCTVHGGPDIVPNADVVLARMLMLETDEKRFREIAYP